MSEPDTELEDDDGVGLVETAALLVVEEKEREAARIEAEIYVMRIQANELRKEAAQLRESLQISPPPTCTKRTRRSAYVASNVLRETLEDVRQRATVLGFVREVHDGKGAEPRLVRGPNTKRQRIDFQRQLASWMRMEIARLKTLMVSSSS